MSLEPESAPISVPNLIAKEFTRSPYRWALLEASWISLAKKVVFSRPTERKIHDHALVSEQLAAFGLTGQDLPS